MICRFPPGACRSWASSWWLRGWPGDDISHEGLRTLLREEGVSFQRIKTWKASKDPDYAAKKARIEHLYAIAGRGVAPEAGETTARDRRAGARAVASNVEIACTPTYSSWLNRIEAQFTALRYFALDGTDHASQKNRQA